MLSKLNNADAAISFGRLVGSSSLEFSGFKHARSELHDNQSDLQEGRKKEENMVQGHLNQRVHHVGSEHQGDQEVWKVSKDNASED